MSFPRTDDRENRLHITTQIDPNIPPFSLLLFVSIPAYASFRGSETYTKPEDDSEQTRTPRYEVKALKQPRINRPVARSSRFLDPLPNQTHIIGTVEQTFLTQPQNGPCKLELLIQHFRPHPFLVDLLSSNFYSWDAWDRARTTWR